MGQIRKIGDNFYIEFYARGLMYSQIAGPTLADAERLLKETESKIAGGEALTVVREIDLGRFFEQFLIYAGQEFSPKTFRRFSQAAQHFGDYIRAKCPQVMHISHVTPAVVDGYKIFLSTFADAKLVNFTILLLSEAFEYAIKLGFINDNPCLHVRLLSLPAKRYPPTERHTLARDLFAKSVPFAKVYRLIGLNDIGRLMYFVNLIPSIREEMYN
jgi:hypothetical protein